MPLSYKAFGRYLEGNIVIYSFYSAYSLVFNYLVFRVFSYDVLSVQDLLMVYILNIDHIAYLT